MNALIIPGFQFTRQNQRQRKPTPLITFLEFSGSESDLAIKVERKENGRVADACKCSNAIS